VLLEFLYHGGDLALPDLFWALVALLFYLLFFLTPFILCGLAIYILGKKKNAKDV
jgi:hypothetical protein